MMPVPAVATASADLAAGSGARVAQLSAVVPSKLYPAGGLADVETIQSGSHSVVVGS